MAGARDFKFDAEAFTAAVLDGAVSSTAICDAKILNKFLFCVRQNKPVLDFLLVCFMLKERMLISDLVVGTQYQIDASATTKLAELESDKPKLFDPAVVNESFSFGFIEKREERSLRLSPAAVVLIEKYLEMNADDELKKFFKHYLVNILLHITNTLYFQQHDLTHPRLIPFVTQAENILSLTHDLSILEMDSAAKFNIFFILASYYEIQTSEQAACDKARYYFQQAQIYITPGGFSSSRDSIEERLKRLEEKASKLAADFAALKAAAEKNRVADIVERQIAKDPALNIAKTVAPKKSRSAQTDSGFFTRGAVIGGLLFAGAAYLVYRSNDKPALLVPEQPSVFKLV